MGLFDEIFGPFGGALTAEQLKAQADAMQQFDPEGALLLKNLEVLMSFRNHVTPEERDQINALVQSLIRRLEMMQAPQQGTAITETIISPATSKPEV